MEEIENQLPNELEGLTVLEAKKLDAFKKLLKFLMIPQLDIKVDKDKKKAYKIAAPVATVVVTSAAALSEYISGITNVDMTPIDPTLQGNLGQLVTGKATYQVTSHYGYRKAPTKGASTFHKGVDIALPIGSPVYAPMDGIVIKSGPSGNGGLAVIIESPDGSSRVGMLHLDKSMVNVGDFVAKGQQIAKSGNSGVSTGPHLHLFYQRLNGVNWNYENPLAARGFSNGEVKLEAKVGKSVYRNLGAKINNPMSLTDSNIDWQGRIGTYQAGTGRKFVKFATPELGVRAGMLNIANKAGRGMTINQFAHHYVSWDVASENKFAQDLSSMLGVSRNTVLDFSDEKTLKATTVAVAKLESGSDIDKATVDRVYEDVSSYISDRKVSRVKTKSSYNTK